jgi:ribose 5-phosphate isomerase B
MCITANKIAGVRAVCTTSIETTQLAREHNHANVLALGADELPLEQAKELIKIFLQTPASLEERHVRRIQKIQSLEE